MRADDADARASRLCEYGATGTGKNQGSGEGLREMRLPSEIAAGFLGFLKGLLDVSVDPLVKRVREGGRHIHPGIPFVARSDEGIPDGELPEAPRKPNTPARRSPTEESCRCP